MKYVLSTDAQLLTSLFCMFLFLPCTASFCRCFVKNKTKTSSFPSGFPTE